MNLNKRKLREQGRGDSADRFLSKGGGRWSAAFDPVAGMLVTFVSDYKTFLDS
jgi:hypothetical protein